MGASGGKSNSDTTGETNGQSQYQNAGGQSAAGSNNGFTNISYLDPSAIAAQKARYGNLADSSGANAGNSYGQASQFYGGLLSSPGYDSGTKNAISAIGNAAANEKLDEGKAAAERHAAATNNDAGFTAGLSNLYGQGAADTASRANQNQLAFYNEQQRQKELGGAGLERLFGTAQGAQLGALAGGNNLATLGSGTQSGGSYSNTGTQYGNGSATNQNTSHQAGQQTSTGGSADLANGLGNLLGGGGNGLTDLLKNLFGGGAGSKNPGGGLGSGPGGGMVKQPDGSYKWTNPDPNYGGLPYGQSGSNSGLTPEQLDGLNNGTAYIDPNTGQVYSTLDGSEIGPPLPPGFNDGMDGGYQGAPDPSIFGGGDNGGDNGGDYGPNPWDDPGYYNPYDDGGD